jgi:hypothetical protein
MGCAEMGGAMSSRSPPRESLAAGDESLEARGPDVRERVAQRERVVEERRAAPRYDVRSFAEPLVCRVNPGHEVELVNVSAVGACVEAAFALLPGRPLQLHAHGRGRRAAFEARVSWCRVTAVISGRGVRFTAGLAFMRWIDLTREFPALQAERTVPRVADTHGDNAREM